MNTTTRLRKRNVAVVITVTVLLVSIGVSASAIVSVQNARAQTSTNMTGSMMGGSGSQNKPSMMMGTYGPNITGSVAIGPTIAKAIASQVHVSLANASIIAEKAVGAKAHAAAVRIGVVHGFLVYMAFVVDSNNNFHGVLVDSGNGKVLASTQVSMAAFMRGGMGMMGSGMHQGMMTHSPGMISKPRL
ncbi:MAG: hypothetical protein WAZ77_02110 [Candidatus Nitrosopolaris sp.]|jgi:hypothetical protein